MTPVEISIEQDSCVAESMPKMFHNSRQLMEFCVG